ncbi:type II toxin-antitoxin system RelE/ParE family toxin [Sphingopyxis chilensis]
MRFAKPGKGKSGGYRVITYYAGDDVPVFLLTVFGKGEKVSLTMREGSQTKDIAKAKSMAAELTIETQGRVSK